MINKIAYMRVLIAFIFISSFVFSQKMEIAPLTQNASIVANKNIKGNEGREREMGG